MFSRDKGLILACQHYTTVTVIGDKGKIVETKIFNLFLLSIKIDVPMLSALGTSSTPEMHVQTK